MEKLANALEIIKSLSTRTAASPLPAAPKAPRASKASDDDSEPKAPRASKASDDDSEPKRLRGKPGASNAGFSVWRGNRYEGCPAWTPGSAGVGASARKMYGGIVSLMIAARKERDAAIKRGMFLRHAVRSGKVDYRTAYDTAYEYLCEAVLCVEVSRERHADFVRLRALLDDADPAVMMALYEAMGEESRTTETVVARGVDATRFEPGEAPKQIGKALPIRAPAWLRLAQKRDAANAK